MYKGGVTTNWIFMIILHPEERILLPNILIHFLKMSVLQYMMQEKRFVKTAYWHLLNLIQDNWPFSRISCLAIYDARKEIRENGLLAFIKLNTRQLRGKLWEIKISQTRIMYIIISENAVFFLNICKKQKGKAEKTELDKAINRAKAEGLL